MNIYLGQCKSQDLVLQLCELLIAEKIIQTIETR